jgi:protein-S-isoprenylcysteine O-methyltransferase Ste14
MDWMATRVTTSEVHAAKEPFPWYRLGDLGLTLVFAFSAISSFARAAQEGADGNVLRCVYHGVIGVAIAIMSTLPVLRQRAKVAGEGITPKLLAVIGTYAMLPLTAVPLTWSPDWLLAIVSVGIIVAYSFVCWALLTLRRNFSIFPEARELVRTGPYGLVRHPLYTAYICTYLFLALPRIGPLALILAAAGITAEVLRSRREEVVLRQAFPEYAGYAATVPAFIPRP